MLYWEKVLYPPILATISGEIYITKTENALKQELYYLAKRAIAAFKFPKQSLKYSVEYLQTKTDPWGDVTTIVVTEDDDWTEMQPYFINDEVSYNEIEILVAWMKVYWAEEQISNADNFVDMYTDANIKTFSRANAIDKYIKFYTSFKAEAKELENRYSRITDDGDPALGEINDD